MAGGSKSNAPKARKRVDAASTDPPTTSLVRAKDGSAFAKCDECNKTVPVALISMHSCSLDAKIKMNLEAQVIEKPAEVKKQPAEVKKKPAERKKPSSTEPNPKRLKKLKKGKDPNAPKRPPTAFFLFMDDFRKSYKEANPDAKGVTGVAKEGGEKWKSMSEEEKKPYLDKAAELKAEYEKALEEPKNADKENEEEEGGLEKEEAGSEKEEASAAEKEPEEVLDDY